MFLVVRAWKVCCRIAVVCSLCVGAGYTEGTPALGSSGAAPQEESPPKDDASPKDEAPTKPVDPDERFVRDHLKECLAPTKLEFLDDGKVRLVFNFGQQKEEHQKIFTPNISEKAQSSFRWALDGEYVMDSWGRLSDDELDFGTSEGIRLGNSGMALLNLWFKGDVSVEMAYVQCVTCSPKQIIALAFTNAKGRSIASNFGSQCALFSRGRLVKKTGMYESVPNEKETRMKLALEGEKFVAYRENKRRCEAPFKPKDFESGKVGMIWAGGIAGFVHRLEVVGTIDYETSAKEMRRTVKSK
jgi:hypothetical protein